MSNLLAFIQAPSGQVIEARRGDLTQEECDAIVNAANSHLAHGGGVAGAIVRRGGAQIQDESNAWVRKFGPVPTGQVAVTGPGTLPCKTIIHAVGPVWSGGGAGEEDLLRSAVHNSLLKAQELCLGSIALPAISSGIFGFPKERCARIMVDTALDFFRQNPQSTLRRVCFTNIDQPTASLFAETLIGLKKT
jgi:O-acetyl-ADP-ribose deacetylase (regulator of RNase III)